MKKYLFATILLFSFLKGITQPPNSISGKIKDSATGNPLAFVTIHLSGDSTVTVKNTFSDSSGLYRFNNIEAGVYTLSFSRAGYFKKATDSFVVSDTSQLTIAEQILSSDAKQLSQVTVFSRKPLIEKSVDGVIYNVQQDLLAGGGTAIDVLRKTPLVTVGQDGTPSIRGSSNIRVFINDKPSDIYASSVADALQQIPAEEIVRVEVILYPSAKYDAEGTDGVINIITKRKTVNGANGTVSTNQANRYRNLISSINIRHEKWIFNVDAGGYLYNNKNGTHMSREETNGNMLLQNNESKNNGRTFYSGANIIYVIDSLKNVYGGYRFRTNTNINDRVSFNDYFVADSLTSSFERNTFNKNGNKVNSINAGYSGKSKNQKSELKLFATYFRHKGFNNYALEQFRKESEDYRENFASETTNAELSLQADYSQKFSGIFNFEAGIKSMNRISESVNEFQVYQTSSGKFIEDNIRYNEFKYDRDIYAAYTNLNFTLKTWQIRVGSRYEQTILRADFKDTSLNIPDYKNYIPSLLISKSIGSNHTVKLSYNKQILRPYMVYLNPAINYSDSLNQEFGNPYLLPEITHRYDLGYTGNFKKIFAGFTLFYNRNRNSIENIRIPSANGVFKSTYMNIGKKDAAGISGNISWRGSKITISTNMTLRYMMLSSAALQMTHNGLQFNGNANLSWKLKNGYSIEGMANINTDDIRLQGSREGWKYYSLSLNKKLYNEKLTFTLRTETYNRYITEDFKTNQFYQRTDMRYQNFFMMIGISYKFGKKEIKVPVTQQASSD